MRAAAERRVPIAVCDHLRLLRIGDVDHAQAAVAPRAKSKVAGDQSVMQRVAFAFRPCRRLAAGRPHPRQPEFADHMRPGRLRHVNDHQHMIGKFRQMHGDIGVAAADIPDAMRSQAAERQKRNFARRLAARNIIDAQAPGKFLPFQCRRRRAGKIRFLADLHGPDAGAIDCEQEVLVRLQVMRACIRRAGEEIHRFGMLGIAHVDNGDAVGETMADIGVAAIDHHLNAVSAAALVGVAHKFDVPAGNGSHRTGSLLTFMVTVMAGTSAGMTA